MHRCSNFEAEPFSRPRAPGVDAKLMLMRFSGRLDFHLSDSIFEPENQALPRNSSREIVLPTRNSKRSDSNFEASTQFPDGAQIGAHRVVRPAREQST